MISSSGDDVPVWLAVEENEYNKAHQVFRCAQIIRGELLAVRNTMAWPPTPEDLVENNVDIRDLVYNLLAWVLYGDSGDEAVSDEKLSLSDTNRRHVMSIAQDMLHVVSNGRVKTPKHVVLPLTERHLTRSSQLVEILNHFGHSLSNRVVQEVETAMAERHWATRGGCNIHSSQHSAKCTHCHVLGQQRHQ